VTTSGRKSRLTYIGDKENIINCNINCKIENFSLLYFITWLVVQLIGYMFDFNEKSMLYKWTYMMYYSLNHTRTEIGLESYCWWCNYVEVDHAYQHKSNKNDVFKEMTRTLMIFTNKFEISSIRLHYFRRFYFKSLTLFLWIKTTDSI
jgi:hypothetical protein